ncbi:PilZ domain-containing protein [Sphingomicrobium astaxanthinifaciens]|uniref:PilZ domain-containing protein n=1 Tax=Sphingomicrobium astaxanthinifaciens TaxID=1227949 RepID=UPI001FCC04DD|nr:PilZ domain-containing protein [Sphingomicrobium astaxanthinifaciens]MCJ7422082.1 PilZ domain-containing protein [Sphingomicrobium astaxanthinifaciens]
MDQSHSPQNRKSPRSHLFMKATLESGGREQVVRLRNLSAEGALVEGDQLPVEGTELLFRRDGLSVPGRIAWTAEGRAGIAFAQALEPEIVLRHVPQPKPRPPMASRRPPVRSSELSEGERRYAQEWVFRNPGDPPARGR